MKTATCRQTMFLTVSGIGQEKKGKHVERQSNEADEGQNRKGGDVSFSSRAMRVCIVDSIYT